LLRATKLDELPQLWNVVCGNMALVGPRPEVPTYVDPSDPLWRSVLEARPGITSPMAAHLRDEESLLGQVPAPDRGRFYAESLQRYKLLGDLAYLQQRSALEDLRVILRTVLAVAGGSRRQPSPDEVARIARAGVRPPI
jgi:lipopolysaccharide/colanic/teichoic acid biosynthesis glycosyltransferase